MDDIIVKARIFSLRKHEGQLDDTGKDFWEAHVAPVGHLIEWITKDEEIIAAAWLHDTLEDTDTTPIEIENEFGPRVARLVWEVTHTGNKKTGYIFPNLKSRDAILIKFADRLQNLSRMEAWDEKRQNQYLRKSKFWTSQI